jgi:hypothetical protein
MSKSIKFAFENDYYIKIVRGVRYADKHSNSKISFR